MDALSTLPLLGKILLCYFNRLQSGLCEHTSLTLLSVDWWVGGLRVSGSQRVSA